MSNGDIIESIRRRTRNHTCESCGETPTWNIQDGTFALLEITADDDLDPANGIPVYAVVCGTCGFIRLYSTAIGDS
jgi:hypothetical protein